MQFRQTHAEIHTFEFVLPIQNKHAWELYACDRLVVLNECALRQKRGTKLDKITTKNGQNNGTLIILMELPKTHTEMLT